MTTEPAPIAPAAAPAAISKAARRTGLAFSAVTVLMIAFSGTMKLLRPPGTAEGFEHLGWAMAYATPLAVLQLACALLYALPRTAVLGAILLTGYLGGATATHVRVGDPFFAPVIFGVLVWGGLWLRDPRLRALLPLRA